MNTTPGVESPSGQKSRFVQWQRRVLIVCAIILALEVGLFLVVFPWKSTWEQSWVPVHSPRLTALWLSPFFRGAVSGLGMLNIYISIAEAWKHFGARRPSPK